MRWFSCSVRYGGHPWDAMGCHGMVFVRRRCVWVAGGLQSELQPDFGRGCGEDCRGAAKQQADKLEVSGSLPRVACCGGFVRSAVWWVRGGGLCVNKRCVRCAGGSQSRPQPDFEQSAEPSEVCCCRVGMHGVCLIWTRRVLRAVECCVCCRMYQ